MNTSIGLQNNYSSAPQQVDPGLKLGWTSRPSGRGTMDIMWSCSLTTFLCCWSVMVVNVPAPGSTAWQALKQRLLCLCLCALAPEIIFQTALGQWYPARRAAKLFHQPKHKNKYKNWSIKYSFFADMGVIRLRSPDFPSFPINAKQLHYLVDKGYIEYPEDQ